MKLNQSKRKDKAKQDENKTGANEQKRKQDTNRLFLELNSVSLCGMEFSANLSFDQYEKELLPTHAKCVISLLDMFDLLFLHKIGELSARLA